MSTPSASAGEKPLFGRRVVILLIVAFVALYVGGLYLYSVENNVPVVTYDLDKEKPSGGLNVSSKIVAVDPVKKIATVEIDPRPYGDDVSNDDDDAPDKDVTLDVNTSGGRKTLEFNKNKPMGAQQIMVNLASGDVATYPLDAYDAQVFISATYNGDEAEAMTVASSLTAKGYIATQSIDKGSTSDEINVDYRISRSYGSVVFAFAVMIFMALLALFALTVASTVAIGGRKFEFGMLAWMGAILFALPALRNAWPNGPPVGAVGDFADFFWAEIIVIFCISLLVLTWYRRTKV